MTDQLILAKYVGAFVDELSRAGIADVVISPGSRSTPLAMVMADHPSITTWIHVDERSAGFFALGMAKAQQKPVALLCSSGTAGANYYPAVIEATQSKIPLIVLTADRPHELRDNGAPQAINQNRLFGEFPKWFMDVSMPNANEGSINYIRTVASRAASVSLHAPAGPIHLNFPFRDPLVPDLSLPTLYKDGREGNEPWVKVPESNMVINDTHLSNYANALKGKKGIIVVGPQEDKNLSPLIYKLAKQLAYPVLADPLSKCRNPKEPLLIEGYDAFLKGDIINALTPDVVLRFGAMPVSKAYMKYIQQLVGVQQIIVEESGWRDPTLSSTDMIIASPSSFCNQLLNVLEDEVKKESSSEWIEMWQAINDKTIDVLLTAYEDTMFEGNVFRELAHLIAEETLLFVGNSMPVRDLDNFFIPRESSLIAMGNRGANGIDGVVSTAIGASVSYESTVLVIGDLSFYHDMNGLLLAKLYNLDMTIVVVNNDGGGIFSFLPQGEKEHEKHFEHLFGTPIGLDYEHAASLYGAQFSRAANWEEFRSMFVASQKQKGLNIIEINTDRVLNKTLHREVFSMVSNATAPLLKEYLKQ